MARLADGVSLEAAQAEMTLIAQRLEATYGNDHDGIDASVIPLHEYTVGRSRQLLVLLLGGVGVVLLATCANVGNMVMARGTDRLRELAVRQALGAGRGRIVRMLFVENAVLAAAGVGTGVLASVGLVRGLVALAPASIPRLDEVGIDVRTTLAAAALAVVTPLLFGLLPSWQISRAVPRETLAEGGRSGTQASGGRARQGFVAVEIAIALLLVTGAGLLGRSFLRLLDVELGFRPDRVLTLQTTVPGSTYPDPEDAARLYDRWLAQAATVPGVEAVGLVNAPPLSGFDANGGFMLEGQDWADIQGNWTAQSAVYRVASGAYFDAMGMTVRRGRTFDATDVAGGEPVAVINEALARKHFAGVDPIGRRIRFAGMDAVNPWLTIVGVVADIRFRDPAQPAQPEVFVDFRQLPTRTRYFVTTAIRLRPGFSDAALVSALRDEWRRLDPDVPLEFDRMVTLVDRATANRRFTFAVVGAFGALALVLAAIGVYGILAYTVTQRSREIGIRMALGASRGAVTRLVFGGVIGAVGAGVAAGIVAAAGLTRFLESFLYDNTALDPSTFAGAAAVLVLVSLAAAWSPIRRAARIDPAIVMREE
ncbi:MAG: FtsX-like permease family protein [Vicinamibacterales bacterium]